MFRYIKKLPAFATVGAGQMATLLMPKGWTYRSLVLKYKRNGVAATEAEMKSDLTAIRIKVNGEAKRTFSAKEVLDIETSFLGETVEAGILHIPLQAKWLKTIQAQDNLSWGTLNLDTLSIEVDIDAGAVTPSLEAHTEVDPVGNALGAIIESRSYHYNAAGAGTLEISDLPKSFGQLVGLHMDTAVVSAFALTINGQEIVSTDVDVLNSLYKRKPMQRVPQAGWVHFDPLVLNRLGDVINMNAEDWRLKLTTTGAGTIGLYVQTLNAPLGLPNIKG